MALDKLVDSSRLDGALAYTADAIREKTGEIGELDWNMDTGFASYIDDISTGIDTSDADATSSDILNGKTAYANGEKVEGNIPTKNGSNLSASGKTVTVPAGYYAQQYTKDVATGSASTPATTITANPSISVNSSGLITATASATKSVAPTVSAGYISSGTAGTITVSGSNTSQLSTQSAKTVTPTESEQTAVASGKYTTGAVKVGAISSIYVGSAIAQNDSDDLTASGATVTAPAGYYAENATKTIASGSVVQNAPTVNSSTGVVTATSTVTTGYVTSDTKSNTLNLSTQSGKTVTPTESEQTAVASGKYTTGAIKVGAISSTYVGSAIAQNDSDDLTASGATVTAPAGYYAEDATKTIGNGTVVASVSSNTSGSASMSATGFTASSSSTSYYVNLSTTPGSVKAKATGGTAGYVTSSTTNETSATSVAVSGNGNKLYIPTTGVKASVSSNTGGSASMTATGMAPLSSGTSNYYVTLSTTAGSVKAKAVGNGTGIITSSTSDETSATSVAVSGNNTKMYIPEATFANSATSGTTYTDKSSTGPVLIAGDYLYINKGYTPDIKISLAKLVPDGSDVKGHGEYIISGHSAYDNDGALVAGTIPTLVSSDLTVNGKTVTVPLGKYTGESGGTAVSTSIGVGKVTSGTASITSLTRTYNSTNGNFDITGSANVSAPTVNTAGYISSSEGTKSAKTGGATVTATVAKIVGSTAITGTTTKKPSISKVATPTGVTNAASGDATTTAPSSGVYVAVKSNANTGTLTATPSVTTAGYGDATNHGITANTATVGAQASDTTYVPITTTTASVSGKTVSYGTGWITEGSKSVADGTVVASVSSNTGGSASMAATGFTAASSATDYYVTLSTSAGSVKAKATGGTAGYVTSSTTNETSATSVSVSGNGNKLYVPAGGVTTSLSADGMGTYFNAGTSSDKNVTLTPKYTNTAGYIAAHSTATNNGGTAYYKIKTTSATVSGGTVSYGTGWITEGSKTVSSGTITNNTTLPSGSASSGTVNRGSYIKIGAGYYGSDAYYYAQNVSNGTIANNTTLPSGSSSSGTVNRGSYIKIGAGYYSSDKYYYAQANSGTKTITGSGETDVNGYAKASVAAVSGSIGGSASRGSATAAISNVNSMATITDLSGKTAGTDYYEVKATATGSAGSYTPKYTVSTAGWIGSTVTGTAQSVSVSSDSTGKSVYIPKAGITNSGGELSNTTNYSGTPTVSLALDSQSTSGISITDTAQSSGYYVKLTGSTAKMTGTTKVTRAAYKETRTAGYCPAMAETTILSSTTSSPSVTVNAASKTRYLTLPTATFAVSANKVYCSAGGWVPTGSTSSVLGTVATGTITNNTSGGTSSGTINMGSQIKIGAGYYANDAYYTAKDRTFTYNSTNKILTITY